MPLGASEDGAAERLWGSGTPVHGPPSLNTLLPARCSSLHNPIQLTLSAAPFYCRANARALTLSPSYIRPLQLAHHCNITPLCCICSFAPHTTLLHPRHHPITHLGASLSHTTAPTDQPISLGTSGPAVVRSASTSFSHVLFLPRCL
jgi:hypothetical protein